MRHLKVFFLPLVGLLFLARTSILMNSTVEKLSLVMRTRSVYFPGTSGSKEQTELYADLTSLVLILDLGGLSNTDHLWECLLGCLGSGISFNFAGLGPGALGNLLTRNRSRTRFSTDSLGMNR